MVRIEKNKHLSDQAATFIYSVQFTEFKDVIPVAKYSGPTDFYLDAKTRFVKNAGFLSAASDLTF